MNKISNYLILLPFIFFLAACEKYLDVELQNQLTLEEVFSKRHTTESYLAHVYSFLPQENLIFGNDGDLPGRSDEALYSWLSGVPWLNMNAGAQTPATGNYQTWEHNYQAIKQATVFINNVDMCLEINEQQRAVMKAEARFLRAYYYFLLVRKYGPVFIWGDQDSDITIRNEEIDRHPLDVNIDFIASEYDRAAAVLPETITEAAWQGRVTKGTALAAKSELLLYMARPLFNGAAIYRGLKNHQGEFLFPQTTDPNKWQQAADAAKAVIDLNRYALYRNTSEADPFRRAIKSYMGVYFEFWNEEIIWGRWDADPFQFVSRTLPPQVVRTGFGGYAPSLKLVDTYPMAASGRFPITGYNNGNPVIDPASGYSENGFVEDFVHPLDNWAPIKAHRSTVGRDARFYASVLANGFWYINTYHGQKLVTFQVGGTSPYTQSGDCVKSGYLWRRMSDPSNDTEQGQWGQFSWPYYRLAEIYLNYAEACNEKPARDETEALRYLNLIRERSGLNKLEEAYPEVIGNQQLLRELIRKERMVELAFEGHRYYDIRTWMIAEQEFNGPYYTRNLLANRFEDAWSRTSQVFPGNMVFQPRHYLFPIHQSQLAEMPNITQNYGW